MDKDTKALVQRQLAAFRRLGISVEIYETETGAAYGAGTPFQEVSKAETSPAEMDVIFKEGKLVKSLHSLKEIRTLVREGKVKLHDFGSRRIAEAMVDESIGGKL